MTAFTIGADPELFLVDKTGKFISAVGLIGGSKWEPLPLTEVGHCVQEDNVSVEFNIPPSENCQEFIDNINFVLHALEHQASGMNLSFAKGVSAQSFTDDQLQTIESQTFGCEPDFNVWTMKPNPRPKCEDFRLRSCGGHVHVGTPLDKVAVTKAMDLFLGVHSIKLDNDVKRRKLYGKAGACRFKEYGVEYRTLSNFWIWEDRLKEWVYKQTSRALTFVTSGGEISKTTGFHIRRAINQGNKHSIDLLSKQFAL